MRSGKGYIFLETVLAYYIGGDCFANPTCHCRPELVK